MFRKTELKDRFNSF